MKEIKIILKKINNTSNKKLYHQELMIEKVPNIYSIIKRDKENKYKSLLIEKHYTTFYQRKKIYPMITQKENSTYNIWFIDEENKYSSFRGNPSFIMLTRKEMRYDWDYKNLSVVLEEQI